MVAAAKLALDGRVDAITTAPLHKEALHRAGHAYPGHTELLAELCGVSDFAMMLYLGPDDALASPGGLAVVHVTLHTAMKNVFDRIERRRRFGQGAAGRPLHGAADRHAAADRRLRVNPHGGEGGLFGVRGADSHSPGRRAGLAEGLRLEGPLPTDTLMVRARDGRFDAVVAMYHDQGHIALKLLGMHRAVNVTLGPADHPHQRRPRHGVRHRLAAAAETGSMIEALRVASRLAEKKRD